VIAVISMEEMKTGRYFRPPHKLVMWHGRQCMDAEGTVLHELPDEFPLGGVSDAQSPGRVAVVVAEQLQIAHTVSCHTTTFFQAGFKSAVVVTRDWCVVNASAGMWIVFYNLVPIVATEVWRHCDSTMRLQGTVNVDAQCMLSVWAEGVAYAGLVEVEHVGYLHLDVLAPLFYPRSWVCGLNAALRDVSIILPLMVTLGQTVHVPLAVEQSRAYVGGVAADWLMSETTVSFRGHDQCTSGVLVKDGMLVSFSVDVAGDCLDTYVVADLQELTTLSPLHPADVVVVDAEAGGENIVVRSNRHLVVISLLVEEENELVLWFDGPGTCEENARVQITELAAPTTALITLHRHNRSIYVVHTHNIIHVCGPP
jgi:hypothetical protein